MSPRTAPKTAQGRARRIVRQVTDDQYAELLARQGGVCAICGNPPKEGGRRLNVDHDHRTGQVRGLLCFVCNHHILGKYATPAKLRAAADYLERSAQPSVETVEGSSRDVGSAAELLPFDAPRDFTCSRCPERGTYLMEMDCSNCGLFFTARFTLGHEADASRCPQCECKTAKPVTLSGRRRGSVG